MRVGITDYAAKTLNDVVYVAPSKLNDRVVQFKSMGTVESIKAVSELYSPLSGTITRVNTELDTISKAQHQVSERLAKARAEAEGEAESIRRKGESSLKSFEASISNRKAKAIEKAVSRLLGETQ